MKNQAKLLFVIPVAISATSYYTESVYEGITCGFVTDSSKLITQTGNRFGTCITGYDANNIAVSSQLYSSDCLISGNDDDSLTYSVSISTFADTTCSSSIVFTTTTQYPAGCRLSSNEDYITVYNCGDFSSPPYKSIGGGYVLGYIFCNESSQ